MVFITVSLINISPHKYRENRAIPASRKPIGLTCLFMSFQLHYVFLARRRPAGSHPAN